VRGRREDERWNKRPWPGGASFGGGGRESETARRRGVLGSWRAGSAARSRHSHTVVLVRRPTAPPRPLIPARHPRRHNLFPSPRRGPSRHTVASEPTRWGPGTLALGRGGGHAELVAEDWATSRPPVNFGHKTRLAGATPALHFRNRGRGMDRVAGGRSGRSSARTGPRLLLASRPPLLFFRLLNQKLPLTGCWTKSRDEPLEKPPGEDYLSSMPYPVITTAFTHRSPWSPRIAIPC